MRETICVHTYGKYPSNGPRKMWNKEEERRGNIREEYEEERREKETKRRKRRQEQHTHTKGRKGM